MPYSIRTMKKEEIKLAIEFATKEGWNPGINDAELFYTADPEGFLLGELYQEPIATISAVKYGKKFGFIGFYIVKDEYRKRGYGITIWKEAMNRLRGRNIALDGVITQKDNYKKSGFKYSYSNIRYEGRTQSISEPDIPCINISSMLFDEVIKYDSDFFPETRAKFLKNWVSQPQGISLAILNNNSLSGYGVIRKCYKGYKIGPLFADTVFIADSLFTSLISKVEPEKPVYLDIPEVNKNAYRLITRHKMARVFQTVRMYTSEPPNISLDRTYGVTTFELG